MKATIIQQAPLRLIAAKVKSFPDGVAVAFDELEARLETLRGRKFYGLVYSSGEGMKYYAALVPTDAEEERSFVESGHAILKVEGGPCVRVKLRDWESKKDQIGATFAAMIEEHGCDASRPQMEYYRSRSELHLLLPVPTEVSGWMKGRRP